MAIKEEKYQQLFKESLGLFAVFGYKKTTIEDVAAKLGMTKGNLYFYVKNKRDLYQKTIHWALIKWQAHVIKAVDKETCPRKKFMAMARAAMSYIDTNKSLRKILIHDPEIFTLDREKDRFPEANQAAREVIRSIIDQGIAEKIFSITDVCATTEYLFSVYMMFLIKTYVFLDPTAFQQMFDAALQLNLRGLMHNNSPSTP
ncbi:MAG: TetR/AcrR family transcriptional regulator [Desulfobacula sp.]|nr:TetR/AcrR family transcriptional regulator [Desulfobacula sp.]